MNDGRLDKAAAQFKELQKEVKDLHEKYDALNAKYEIAVQKIQRKYNLLAEIAKWFFELFNREANDIR